VIDVLRKSNNFAEKTPGVVHFYGSSDTHAKPEVFLETEIKDEQLRMIFALCDPVLNNEQQLILTLKVLSGLGGWCPAQEERDHCQGINSGKVEIPIRGKVIRYSRGN
jgi:predicted RNA polymerase sigma factor